ncbi:putative quinol monooxygenase, partial [Serratia marcescens]
MITVIAEIKVKPGHRATVLQAIEKLVPLVLAEDGCGEYTPMVDSNTQAPWQKRSP